MKTRAGNRENNTVTDDKVEAIVGAHISGASPSDPGERESLASVKLNAALIPVLQAVQAEYGYVPETAMNVVGRSLGLSASQIFGVATFYKQFRLTPQGKHLIKVCHGTACHVAGAEGISVALRSDLDVEDGETTADLNFTLEPVACLGCCSLAPVMMVADETHGRLTPDKAKKIVAKYAPAKVED